MFSCNFVVFAVFFLVVFALFSCEMNMGRLTVRLSAPAVVSRTELGPEVAWKK